MKKLCLKFHLIFFVVLGLAACNPDQSGKAVPAELKDVTGPDNAQKTNKAPQVYDPAQWHVGTWWTWKNSSNTCTRWTILENSAAAGVSVQQSSSGDCQTFSSKKSPQFHFFPSDGVIDWAKYQDGSHPPKDSLPTVYGWLFGDSATARTYTWALIKNPFTTTPLFSPEKTKSWYLDAPGTALHGVLYQSETLLLVDFGR